MSNTQDSRGKSGENARFRAKIDGEKNEYYVGLSDVAKQAAPSIETALKGLSVAEALRLLGCVKEKLLEKTKAGSLT